ncbi:MAG: primosomal protein N' [Coriobacteriales bacterium]|nr:primosomal protein N' [Coriobacteriales bacterium]
MRYAQVVLDIPTRQLEGAFCYAIPDGMEDDAQVGATVLVTFSHRTAVGYVVEVLDQPPAGLNPSRIASLESVLAGSAFDEARARLAVWMASEYACPLSEAIRPFLAPGQGFRVRRVHDGGPWELESVKSGPVDERWVRLTEEGRSFEPRRTAARQRALIASLAEGPVRMAELSVLMSGAASVVSSLEKRGVVAVEERRRVRGGTVTTLSSANAPRPEKLTAGQKCALAAIAKARKAARGDVVLIDGVTGSGKTEVYLDAIEAAIADGKRALVLVPEISLTAQTVGRFRSRFGDDVAILHSRLSVGERFDQWDLARQGLVHVVVGARSALFAPLSDLGLIIIDEEHEHTYKQESAPRYHARDVAAQLAAETGCALVLGSATPSLESINRCEAGVWRNASWTCVQMPERPGVSQLPRVSVVDMTQQFQQGNRSVFSKPLTEALQAVAQRREKAVLLLNRRGFATFLMCRDCGCVPECPHCSTSLTYHERTRELMCHTCGRSWPQRAFPDPMTRCPNCGSRYMAAFGVGTQRVEDELRMLLPEDVDIVRMDADTTRTKGAHQRLLEEFDASECAVLVGTQMIAKGLDFPEVTLVGVVNADTTLKMPDFRAAERTYDLLEQVAGRAGRGVRAGEVIVQTYWAGHPAIQAVARHDRDLFLAAEEVDRRDGGYPPFSRLANVVIWGKRASEVRASADELAAYVHQQVDGRAGWEVLGPADCAKAKAKDNYRRHVLVKAPIDASLGELLGSCARQVKSRPGVNLAVDVDAYDLL